MGRKKDTALMITEQTEKLKQLEDSHDLMKEANRYFKKHGSLNGFHTRVEYWRVSRQGYGGGRRLPFSADEIRGSWKIIQRTKERLAFLRERQATEEKETHREQTMECRTQSVKSAKTEQELKAPREAALTSGTGQNPADEEKRPSFRQKLEAMKEISKTASIAAEGKRAEQDMDAFISPVRSTRDGSPMITAGHGDKQDAGGYSGGKEESFRDYLTRKCGEKPKSMKAADEAVRSTQNHQKSSER